MATHHYSHTEKIYGWRAGSLIMQGQEEVGLRLRATAFTFHFPCNEGNGLLQCSVPGSPEDRKIYLVGYRLWNVAQSGHSFKADNTTAITGLSVTIQTLKEYFWCT